MKSYSSDRATWTIKIQQNYALDIYRKHWLGCRIEEIDSKAITEPFARRMDFSGLDKIIYLENGHTAIHLAQRFRKPRKDGKKVDFSFRYETPSINGTQESEYYHFINAYKNGTYYPNRYAFGVTKGKSTECGGFTEFYIYDLPPLLKAIDLGMIRKIGIYDNGDGSKGIYFRLSDLSRFVEYRLEPKKQPTLNDF